MISEIEQTKYSDENDLKIFDVLIEWIKEHNDKRKPDYKANITYSTLVDKVSAYSIIPVNVGTHLGRVSNFCKENNAPAISAIVGSIEKCEPSKGFFEVLGCADLSMEQKLAKWMPLFNAVYDYPIEQWQELREKYKNYIENKGEENE